MKRELQTRWLKEKKTPAQLLEIMNGMEGHNVVRDRGLFAFLYMTGARIQEVVRYTSKQQPWDSIHSIRKNQVVIEPLDATRITVNAVRCLKRKMYRYTEKRIEENGVIVVKRIKNPDAQVPPQYRDVAIKVNNEERPFWEAFKAYYDTLGVGDELFPFSSHRARQILKKVKIHPHALRHQRFSHFVKYYRMPSQQLRRQAGWASSLTADHYVDADTGDILDTMTPRG